MNPDDNDFIREMRALDNQNIKLIAAMQELRLIIASTAVECGVTGGMLLDDEVTQVVNLAMNLHKQGTGKTEVLPAIRTLLAAAFRFAEATVQGVDRLTNPANKDGPDEPLYI